MWLSGSNSLDETSSNKHRFFFYWEWQKVSGTDKYRDKIPDNLFPILFGFPINAIPDTFSNPKFPYNLIPGTFTVPDNNI